MKVKIFSGLLGVAASVGAAVTWLALSMQDMSQYEMHLTAPATPEDEVTLTWFGVSAVLIRDKEHAVFVDPFFSRPEGLLPMLLNRDIAPNESLITRALRDAGLEKLDAVLVSHSHFDHAMDAGVVARLMGAGLVGSPSTLNVGRGAGLSGPQLLPAPIDAPLDFGSFRVRFVSSAHAGATGGRPTGDIDAPLLPPVGYMAYRQGGTYSILIEHKNGSILHHGSAGYRANALRGIQADTVLLGVALVDSYPEYFHAVVDAVKARTVMPVHWDNFTRSLEKPLKPMPVVVRLDRFFDHLAGRPDLRMATMPLGLAVPAFQ